MKQTEQHSALLWRSPRSQRQAFWRPRSFRAIDICFVRSKPTPGRFPDPLLLKWIGEPDWTFIYFGLQADFFHLTSPKSSTQKDAKCTLQSAPKSAGRQDRSCRVIGPRAKWFLTGVVASAVMPGQWAALTLDPSSFTFQQLSPAAAWAGYPAPRSNLGPKKNKL